MLWPGSRRNRLSLTGKQRSGLPVAFDTIEAGPLSGKAKFYEESDGLFSNNLVEKNVE